MSGGKNHPKVGVHREKFNIGNLCQILLGASIHVRTMSINFRLVAKIQKVRGTLVTVTLTVTVKNFSWGNVAKMK